MSDCSTCVTRNHPSLLLLSSPSVLLHPSFHPLHSLLSAVNINRTSLSSWAVMHPPIRKSTHSALGVPMCSAYSSISLGLVSQIFRVWSLLSGGMRGQLNIYGSTSIQMFGNGEILWPEKWHGLFVRNMRQGRCRACPQHVSVCVWLCWQMMLLW